MCCASLVDVVRFMELASVSSKGVRTFCGFVKRPEKGIPALVDVIRFRVSIFQVTFFGAKIVNPHWS